MVSSERDGNEDAAAALPHPLRPLPGVYGGVASDYLDTALGWPIPLPEAKKHPPRTGYTGGVGKRPTPAKVRMWSAKSPRSNVALRLAPTVLGLDVDAYDGRVGGQTLALAESTWGPLPPTVRSSSRRDGRSGIYLFRVPAGLSWPSAISADLTRSGRPGNIELVHFGHRYVVSWPSEHPNGERYWWWGPDGAILRDLPSIDQLPALPEAWVAGLVKLRQDRALDSARPSSPSSRSTLATPRSSVDNELEPGRAAGVVICDETLPTAWRSVHSQAKLVRAAPEGKRNEALNKAAYVLGGNLGVAEQDARSTLVRAAVDSGQRTRLATRTFISGWTAGRRKPYRL